MIGISVIKELPGSFVFFCPVNASGNSIFDFLLSKYLPNEVSQYIISNKSGLISCSETKLPGNSVMTEGPIIQKPVY